jgi:hypothetical protein
VTAATYALRFLAGTDPGVEFPLDRAEAGEILIGRAQDADLVLDDTRVSRTHARVFTEMGRLFIEDMGSTNGVYVNAKRVWLSALNEGDRVQIGASLLKLVPALPSAEGGRLERTDLFFPPEMDDLASTSSEGKPALNRFSGAIDEIPLLDLVQLLSTSKKSGVLEVESAEGHGSLYLRSGKVDYAAVLELPGLDPHKALYRMLSWTSGSFELRPLDDETFEDAMQEPTDALLMEAMRQLDEIARLEKLLPPKDVRLVVASPVPSLRKLNPEQVEVLKIVFNEPGVNVATILDSSPTPDLETYLALIHLVRARYVAVAG